MNWFLPCAITWADHPFYTEILSHGSLDHSNEKNIGYCHLSFAHFIILTFSIILFVVASFCSLTIGVLCSFIIYNPIRAWLIVTCTPSLGIFLYWIGHTNDSIYDTLSTLKEEELFLTCKPYMANDVHAS